MIESFNTFGILYQKQAIVFDMFDSVLYKILKSNGKIIGIEVVQSVLN